uniref:Uncharacterized protein n=1 Tax=Kalanchoe fedtschenkoi TaxID=63787 RepID=A0A7N0RDV1_KALFE
MELHFSYKKVSSTTTKTATTSSSSRAGALASAPPSAASTSPRTASGRTTAGAASTSRSPPLDPTYSAPSPLSKSSSGRPLPPRRTSSRPCWTGARGRRRLAVGKAWISPIMLWSHSRMWSCFQP